MGDDGGVRGRSGLDAGLGRDEGRQGQGLATRRAAQTQPTAGGAPGGAAPRRRAHRWTLLYRRARTAAVQLEQNNTELQEANAVRDHLVAVVSRELRTLLTGLAGIVEILQDGRDLLAPRKINDVLGCADALTAG